MIYNISECEANVINKITSLLEEIIQNTKATAPKVLLYDLPEVTKAINNGTLKMLVLNNAFQKQSEQIRFTIDTLRNNPTILVIILPEVLCNRNFHGIRERENSEMDSNINKKKEILKYFRDENVGSL